VWVRLAVSAALLALVASRINFGVARERIAHGSWGYFAAAAAALLASFVIAAVRWRIFLLAAGIAITTLATVRAYLIGTFANNFLPSQLGGDVARAWIAGGPHSKLRSAATVVVDKATALFCLLCVGWMAVAANPGPVPEQLIGALAAATIAFLIAGFALTVALRTGWLLRLSPARTRNAVAEIASGLDACIRPTVLGKTFLVGLVFQGFTTLSAWLALHAINLQAPFSVIAASLAPVLIISAAPVSIGGLGVREGAYVWLLGYAGIGATDATVFSLTTAAAFAVASLAGAVALLRKPSDVDPVREVQR
jgi:glycosyltransferase 2 family protein